jgi:hypothetical protein
MRKGRCRDVEKERQWREVIRMAARSGLSIRESCRERRVKESQFVLARNSSGIFWGGFVLVLFLNIFTSDLSLTKTLSQPKSMVYETRSFPRIVEEDRDACELDQGGRVYWRETASLSRVIPRWRFGSDASYESGSLPIVPMMQST